MPSLLVPLDASKCFAVNLGPRAGSSVLEVIRSFERASGKKMRYPSGSGPAGKAILTPLMPGTAYTHELLGWRATRTSTVCAPATGTGKSKTLKAIPERSHNAELSAGPSTANRLVAPYPRRGWARCEPQL